jgi:hypothetical protein
MIAALIPDAPVSPAKLSATKTDISIQWSAPLSNGGAVIRHYLVYSNDGVGGLIFTLVG